MDNPSALIIGGYGNAGLSIARLLLGETPVRLVLGGRNLGKAQQAAETFNREFGAERVTAREVDCANRESLRRTIPGHSIVVVASSTIDYTRNVAEAALEAGIDYFDIQIASSAKHLALQALTSRIEEAGRCFITDGGFRPGIPATLVRFAATQIPHLESAVVASAFQVDWKAKEFALSSAAEFVDELESYSTLVLRNGVWSKAKFSEMQAFDFGTPFGAKSCTPMFMEEFRSLPKAIPTLTDTGFYSAGFGAIVDYGVIPVSLLLVKLFPVHSRNLVARLFLWGLKNGTRPPYGSVLKMDAKGTYDDKQVNLTMTVSHEDPYLLTAISAAICLQQYFCGTIRRPGLWCQAELVEPVHFVKSLERLGATVQVCLQ